MELYLYYVGGGREAQKGLRTYARRIWVFFKLFV
jgi:hypothetical protein